MFKKIISLSTILILTSCQLPFQNQEEEEISISLQSNFITPISQNSTGQNFIGNVHSAEQVKIQSQNAGQIIKSLVKDGDQVQKGDLLYQIGGVNNSKHPLEVQFQIAQNNLELAKENLKQIELANQNTLNLTQAQINSAQNQAKAFENDLKTFNYNLAANQEAKNILQNNLENNNFLTQQNFQKADLSLQEIENNLNYLNTNYYNNINDLNQLIDSTTDLQAKNELIKKLNSATLDYQQKKSSLNNQIQIAQLNQNSITNSAELSNNQIKTQLLQNQLQNDLTQINQESSKLKMGYTGESTDQIKTAKLNQEGATIKNNLNSLQAQNQLHLAQINFDNAKQQLETLNIYAPIDGIIYGSMANQGDLIGPQNILTQIINPDNLELQVEVKNEDILKVKKAQIPYGDKFIDLPIKQISTIANPQSQLSTITFYLPNLPFNPNQQLNVLLNFTDQNINQNKLLIPIESLNIDDNNQKFVYLQRGQELLKQDIQVGQIQNNLIEVLSGLNPNDKILIN